MKTKRTCTNGHTYYKSSTCTTCPQCEQQRKPTNGFMADLSAPAIRALEQHHLLTLSKIANLTEAELRLLHGIGPSAITKIKIALHNQGMTFKPQ